MTLADLIEQIELKHRASGITLNPPATAEEIQRFEKIAGFKLPDDFRKLYSFCTGCMTGTKK